MICSQRGGKSQFNKTYREHLLKLGFTVKSDKTYPGEKLRIEVLEKDGFTVAFCSRMKEESK